MCNISPYILTLVHFKIFTNIINMAIYSEMHFRVWNVFWRGLQFILNVNVNFKVTEQRRCSGGEATVSDKSGSEVAAQCRDPTPTGRLYCRSG